VNARLYDLYPDCSRIDGSDRQLSGTIPATMGLFEDVRSIDLSGNSLTGTIPSELGLLLELTYLNLSSNSLSGTFPPEILRDAVVDVRGNFLIPGTEPATVGNFLADFLPPANASGPGTDAEALVAGPDAAAGPRFGDFLANVTTGVADEGRSGAPGPGQRWHFRWGSIDEFGCVVHKFSDRAGRLRCLRPRPRCPGGGACPPVPEPQLP